MYYLIRQVLEEVSIEEIKNSTDQYVVVLSFEEWKKNSDFFDMCIDLEIDATEVFTTKAEVNYDSLTGSFSIPDRRDMSGDDSEFCFALDEKGIVFIDDSGTAQKLIQSIQRTKKWRMPSLERVLYDFLDQIVKDDLRLMEKYDQELDEMEQAILNDEDGLASDRVNEIRSDIRNLRIHYEQLIDLGQEFQENENEFFKPENLRYFHMFTERVIRLQEMENSFFKQENLRYFRLFLNRMARLHDNSTALRDYTMQIRDLYKAHLDIKQNRIMTVLTVVTTIFLPLTLIVGWYGMNFKYMPELEWEWGYPAVIGISFLIVLGSLLFFRKKKWL